MKRWNKEGKVISALHFPRTLFLCKHGEVIRCAGKDVSLTEDLYPE